MLTQNSEGGLWRFVNVPKFFHFLDLEAHQCKLKLKFESGSVKLFYAKTCLNTKEKSYEYFKPCTGRLVNSFTNQVTMGCYLPTNFWPR